MMTCRDRGCASTTRVSQQRPSAHTVTMRTPLQGVMSLHVCDLILPNPKMTSRTTTKTSAWTTAGSSFALTRPFSLSTGVGRSGTQRLRLCLQVFTQVCAVLITRQVHDDRRQHMRCGITCEGRGVATSRAMRSACAIARLGARPCPLHYHVPRLRSWPAAGTRTH